jgi:hypothetical protein
MVVQGWRHRWQNRGGKAAPARPERAREQRHNPVSLLVWLAGWAAALILVAGTALTYARADMSNAAVHAVMDAGRWLATPFSEVFSYRDRSRQLYANWLLAAAVYWIIGRMLSWLIRR